MAVYRKKLVDKDGNTIIPAIGDIYGPVYIASLQSASGGVATYTFTPDTPVEPYRVYAVQFPEPTVNNAVILLGDGTMTACSILLPPVAASDSPSYELAYTYNTNDTEVWLLMYNGVGQWICLNQKRPDYTIVQGTTSLSVPVNCAYKYTDGTLVCYQRYDFSGKSATSAWGNVYSGQCITPVNFAVPFTGVPVVQKSFSSIGGNFWLATRTEDGYDSATKPGGVQLIRPTSYSGLGGYIFVTAVGEWKTIVT